MKVKSVRLLNERNGWFGLSVWDICGLGYFLLIAHTLLALVGLELLSFVLTGLAALVLLSIRLKARPKTIRDFIRSKITSKVQ